jgi:hypothetical protein
MMNRLKLIFFTVTGAALVLLPDAALACEKCYAATATDTPTVKGIGLAMLGLLLITVIVLGGIVAFFLYMRKRARMIASGEYIVTEKGVLLSLPRRLVEKTG